MKNRSTLAYTVMAVVMLVLMDLTLVVWHGGSESTTVAENSGNQKQVSKQASKPAAEKEQPAAATAAPAAPAPAPAAQTAAQRR